MKDKVAQLLILIIGLVISIVLGVLFYFRADLPTALATFALILGGLLTLQVEATFRRIRDEQAQTQQGQLMAQVEAIPWLQDFVRDTARRVVDIKKQYDIPFVVDMLLKELREEFFQSLDDVQGGRILVPHDSDHKLVFWLTANTKETILATDVYSAAHLHAGNPAGDEYKELNMRALQRGVRIERIFVYSEWTNAVERSMKEQYAAGIHTLRVREASLTPELRIDMAIWDERYASALSFNASGEIVDSYITFSPQDLMRMLDRYKRIRSAAEPWPDKVDTAAPRRPRRPRMRIEGMASKNSEDGSGPQPSTD